MDRADLYDIAFDILCGIFGEDPDSEIVAEVVSYVENADTEEQAIQEVQDICRRMFG